MQIYLDNDEYVALTLLEIRLLITLAYHPDTSAGLGRRLAHTSTHLTGPISQGSLVPALKRLSRANLIFATPVQPRTGRPYLLYRLTATGELILEWQLSELEHLSAHGRQSLLA